MCFGNMLHTLFTRNSIWMSHVLFCVVLGELGQRCEILLGFADVETSIDPMREIPGAPKSGHTSHTTPISKPGWEWEVMGMGVPLLGVYWGIARVVSIPTIEPLGGRVDV